MRRSVLLTCLLGFLLSVSPLFVSAQSIADLQAQVQALLARIAALQAQQGPTPPDGDDYPAPTDAPSCPNLTITMQRGSRDLTTRGQVSELQIWLASRYNLNDDDVVTGYFGATTERYVKQFQTEKGLPAYGIVGSLTRAAIARECGAGGQAPTTLRVTVPNGGEEWEVGKLHTITWAPYGYAPDVNPARDVVVYLIGTDGDKVGRIMDTGKASLHTYLNIDDHKTWAKPGRYYIEAVNMKTGTRDRSDAPFTILPRAVDMKLNGSDLPVSVSDNQAVSVSWVIGAPYHRMEGGCTLSGLRTAPGASPSIVNLGTSSGSGTYYAYAPTPGSYSSVNITCIDGAKGLTHTDYGNLLSLSGTPSVASMQITSPNGGEQIDVMKPMDISFSMKGLKTPLSIALYKNDTWFSWINKEVGMDKTLNDQYSYSWVPNSMMPIPLGLGNVWKIYITGQKADGTGYVDDKSDKAFSFVGETDESPAPATPPSCTLTTDKESYEVGEPIVFSWTSMHAGRLAFMSVESEKSNVPLPTTDMPASGSQSIVANFAGKAFATLAVYGSDGQSAACSKSVDVSEAPAPAQSVADGYYPCDVQIAAESGSTNYICRASIKVAGGKMYWKHAASSHSTWSNANGWTELTATRSSTVAFPQFGVTCTATFDPNWGVTSASTGTMLPQYASQLNKRCPFPQSEASATQQANLASVAAVYDQLISLLTEYAKLIGGR